LAVPLFLNTIEHTSLSTWIRTTQSVFGFYFILTAHTIGLSLLVGSNAVVDLRILGVAPSLPLKPLKQLFKFMWWGLGINVCSGLLLLTAYPTKALTNYIFYIKLSCIALAVITLRRIYFQVFGDSSLSEADMLARGKTMAKISLALWISAIGAGRLLSETYVYLTYGHKYLR
jgi:hypothetical protein